MGRLEAIRRASELNSERSESLQPTELFVPFHYTSRVIIGYDVAPESSLAVDAKISLHGFTWKIENVYFPKSIKWPNDYSVAEVFLSPEDL